MPLTDQQRTLILRAQTTEATEHEVYGTLARVTNDPKNRRVLEQIAADELDHYRFWREISGVEVGPKRLKAAVFVLLARLAGLHFSLKLMERGEQKSQRFYRSLTGLDRRIAELVQKEEEHEVRLLELLKRLGPSYASSIVLGLNDALVELTGALTGLTLALRDPHTIAAIAFITGFAASLSMAASEYLSVKEEGRARPATSSLYTGVAYVITVFLLILPYFLIDQPLISLAVAFGIALIIIFSFTFYSSIANGRSFKRKFSEMAVISLSVAAINFLVGLIIRHYFKISI